MFEEKQVLLQYDEDSGMWGVKKEPYLTVEFPTKEDWEHMKKVIDFWNANHATDEQVWPNINEIDIDSQEDEVTEEDNDEVE